MRNGQSLDTVQGFVEGLDVESERNEGVKSDYNAFGSRNWTNGTTIYREMEDWEKQLSSRREGVWVF